MSRYLLCMLIAMLLAGAAWTQEDAAESPEAEEASSEESDTDEQPVDDRDLDDQVYTDADDDFRPSEEIPADQSIAFPTDI